MIETDGSCKKIQRSDTTYEMALKNYHPSSMMFPHDLNILFQKVKKIVLLLQNI